MADRKSPEYLKKKTEEVADKLRSKGADAQQINIVHPGGTKEGLKQLEQNLSATVDQCQAQTEANKKRRT